MFCAYLSLGSLLHTPRLPRVHLLPPTPPARGIRQGFSLPCSIVLGLLILVSAFHYPDPSFQAGYISVKVGGDRVTMNAGCPVDPGNNAEYICIRCLDAKPCFRVGPTSELGTHLFAEAIDLATREASSQHSEYSLLTLGFIALGTEHSSNCSPRKGGGKYCCTAEVDISKVEIPESE